MIPKEDKKSTRKPGNKSRLRANSSVYFSMTVWAYLLKINMWFPKILSFYS